MKIAISGTGISGMLAAYLLSAAHEVTIFKANDYIGAHTHTIPVTLNGRTYAVDTGFIVFNDWTYPNFIKLLARLGVASQPSTMSFSVTCAKTGLEYNGTSLNTLFAQRRNLLRPAFHRMIRDILCFNRTAPDLRQDHRDDPTLGDYVTTRDYSQEFVRHYLTPMGAAIWSADPQLMGIFRHAPLCSFLTTTAGSTSTVARSGESPPAVPSAMSRRISTASDPAMISRRWCALSYATAMCLTAERRARRGSLPPCGNCSTSSTATPEAAAGATSEL